MSRKFSLVVIANFIIAVFLSSAFALFVHTTPVAAAGFICDKNRIEYSTEDECDAACLLVDPDGICELKSVEQDHQENLQAEKEAAAAAAASASAPPTATPALPKMEINIPTVKFSDMVRTDTYADIPWLADYLTGIYKYLLSIAAFVAAVMILMGGMQWLTAADSGRVNAAKKRITGAVVGLALAFGSYILLNTINPDLVTFRPLRIITVDKTIFKSEESIFPSEGVYDPTAPDTPDFNGPGVTVTAGQFRKELSKVCGTAAPSSSEKLKKFQEVASVWKQVGVDQGGGIYVRGGTFDCKSVNPEPTYVIKSMAVLKNNGIDLKLSPECKAMVDSATAPKGQSPCHKEMQATYKREVADKAGMAGMLCGDCFTTAREMVRCWAGKEAMQTVANLRRTCPAAPGGNIVFVLKGKFDQGQLNNAVRQMKPGDVVIDQYLGHVTTYTGGAGLGFDVLEMGAGGSGDISNSGGKLAAKNAGITFKVSGMRANTNPERVYAYSMGKSGEAKNATKCLFAIRPLP